jgi:hypothetical protein
MIVEYHTGLLRVGGGEMPQFFDFSRLPLL